MTTTRRPGASDADKTERMRWALRNKYQADRYAILEEVPKCAGFTMGYADAMVLALWPSDWHTLYGFELKATRSDWKRDLGKDKKHRVHIERCDKYTLLTYGTAVARMEEIPESWGWWSVDEDGAIEVIKRSPTLVGCDQWNKGFTAVLVRRAIEASPSAGLLASVAVHAGEAGRYEYRASLERLKGNLTELRSQIRGLGESPRC